MFGFLRSIIKTIIICYCVDIFFVCVCECGVCIGNYVDMLMKRSHVMNKIKKLFANEYCNFIVYQANTMQAFLFSFLFCFLLHIFLDCVYKYTHSLSHISSIFVLHPFLQNIENVQEYKFSFNYFTNQICS